MLNLDLTLIHFAPEDHSSTLYRNLKSMDLVFSFAWYNKEDHLHPPIVCKWNSKNQVLVFCSTRCSAHTWASLQDWRSCHRPSIRQCLPHLVHSLLQLGRLEDSQLDYKVPSTSLTYIRGHTHPHWDLCLYDPRNHSPRLYILGLCLCSSPWVHQKRERGGKRVITLLRSNLQHLRGYWRQSCQVITLPNQICSLKIFYAQKYYFQEIRSFLFANLLSFNYNTSWKEHLQSMQEYQNICWSGARRGAHFLIGNGFSYSDKRLGEEGVDRRHFGDNIGHFDSVHLHCRSSHHLGWWVKKWLTSLDPLPCEHCTLSMAHGSIWALGQTISGMDKKVFTLCFCFFRHSPQMCCALLLVATGMSKAFLTFQKALLKLILAWSWTVDK